jgi:hypothetical protein
MSRSTTTAVMLLGLAFVGACAAAPATLTSGGSRSAAQVPGSTGLRVNNDNGTMVSDLFLEPTKVWWALAETYEALGIPLTLIDHPKKTLANEGFKVRAKLGEARLSNYFECGTTQVGPNADSYEMYLTILTQLDSVSAAQTRMTTSISAAAKPMLFAQEYSRCTSKGTLEKEILAGVKAKVK